MSQSWNDERNTAPYVGALHRAAQSGRPWYARRVHWYTDRIWWLILANLATGVGESRAESSGVTWLALLLGALSVGLLIAGGYGLGRRIESERVS